uniref:Uncharacterized protein n=1 Tax=Pseudonaja textilis TaxID=8673 RepID=A0A670XW27_PSETE
MAKNSRVLDILASQGERACRLFFYPCLKEVEPHLYSKIRNYVSDVNEKIGDARRQLVGYLLEKDKGWIQKDKALHQGGKGSPRSIKPKKMIYDKPKSKSTLAARQSLDNIPTVFDLVRQGILSNLEKALSPTDVNATNSANETLLHIAASHGHLEIIDYLISKGVKLEVKDNKGRTPLHRAAEKGHDKAVNRLLQAGAYMYSLDQEGKTPLHLANQNQHIHHNFLHRAALKDDSDLVQVLLKNGALVDARDERGQTALSYAASQGHEKTVKVLLEGGAKVDSRNQTPLHVAAIYNRGALVDLLIEGGAKIDAVTTDLFTPLHMASDKGHTDVALKLLQHKANVHLKNKRSKTPLHLAADMGNPAMVELLLNFKADPNATDKEKKSPLHFATLGGHFYAVKALLAKNGLCSAARLGFIHFLHMVLTSSKITAIINFISLDLYALTHFISVNM